MNPKQERFIAEYLIDLNGTQAAIRAGYSKATANRIASNLLSKVDIAEEIARKRTVQIEQADLSATRVLEELRRLSLSDLADAIDESTGKLKPLHQMPAHIRAAIASVKLTKKNLTAGDGVTEDVVEIKLWDKPRALEMLAKHFKLLTDVMQVQDADGHIAALMRGRERVAKGKA